MSGFISLILNTLNTYMGHIWVEKIWPERVSNPRPMSSDSFLHFSLRAGSSGVLKLCTHTKSRTAVLLSILAAFGETREIYFRYLFPVLDQLENFFFEIWNLRSKLVSTSNFTFGLSLIVQKLVKITLPCLLITYEL